MRRKKPKWLVEANGGEILKWLLNHQSKKIDFTETDGKNKPSNLTI